MGFLGDISFGLLGDTSAEEAAQQSAGMLQNWRPTSISSAFGSTDATQGRVTSTLSPELQSLLSGTYGLFNQIQSPDQTYQLLRQQAAPYEQQQYGAMENRLFSQGRLGASAEYAPGGQMRGLFDAQAQADLQRQLSARDQFYNERTNLMNQLGGIYNMEQGLFQAGTPYSQMSQQMTSGAAGIIGQAGASTTQGIQSLIGNAIGGYAMGGGFGNLFGGAPAAGTAGMYAGTPYNMGGYTYQF